MGKKWYVIAQGRPGARLGVYDNWLEAAPNVIQYPCAIYRGFDTEEEAIQMWERSPQYQAQMANRLRQRNGLHVPAHAPVPAPPLDRRRSSTLDGSSTYAGSSTQASLRGNSTTGPPPPFRTRVHSSGSESGDGVGVQPPPRGSVVTSYMTHTRTISRTQSLVVSDRTSSWVAEVNAALPDVPESQPRTTTTRSRTWTDVGRRPQREASHQSPRATVDTSYAISVSSSESSVSDGPLSAQRRLRALASNSTSEGWMDSGLDSQLPTQVRSRWLTASQSLPATEPDFPRRTASPPRAESSTPEVWHTAPSCTPALDENVVSLPESSRLSPSRPSRAAAIPARSQSHTPECQRTTVVSSDATQGLTCQCRPTVCPSCHLPTEPAASSSGGMSRFGFTEPPHLVNLVYPQDADPRSPIRRGVTRVPVHTASFNRPSPLVVAHTGLSSLFSN